MKNQITILETLAIIGIVLILCVLCDLQKNVNQDEVQPLSEHDSTLIQNYILTH